MVTNVPRTRSVGRPARGVPNPYRPHAREPGAEATARPAPPPIEATAIRAPRSPPLGMALQPVGWVARSAPPRSARDRDSLAPAGLPRFLDLEVPPRTSGSTTGRLGDCGSRAHHGAGESALGRATHSRRVAQARPRRLAAKRCPAHAAPPEATLADLPHVPPEPPRRPRLRRLLRRADRDLPRPLCVRGRAASSPQDRALQRDPFPPRRLDRSADRRRFPRGLGAALPPARSRQHLRRRVPSTSEGHGHRRGSYGAPFALAEPLRRARDRNDPPRTTRPRDRPERGTPPSSFAELSPLLPRLADASRAREGCTRAARRRATRARPRRCPAPRRRPPPPLRSPRGVVAVDELSRFGNEIRAQSALAPWSCRRPRRKPGHPPSPSTPCIA